MYHFGGAYLIPIAIGRTDERPAILRDVLARLFLFGGAYRSRTDDLLHAMQTL